MAGAGPAGRGLSGGTRGAGFGALISTTMAKRLESNNAMTSVWIVDVNRHGHGHFADPFPSDGAYHPSASGFAKATAWQFAHQKYITAPATRQKIPVDINSSICKDPGRAVATRRRRLFADAREG